MGGAYQVPGGNQKPGSYGSEQWFPRVCGSADAHGFLREIEDTIADGSINPDEADRIALGLQEFRGRLGSVQCPAVCALSIQILKEFAFLEGVEQLHWPCFTVLADLWREGYQRQKHLKNRDPLVDTIFDPEQFLKGWELDLGKVKIGALPWYLSLLGGEGLHACPRFSSAVSAFIARLRELPREEYAGVAGDVSLKFINEVLDRHLESNRGFVLDQIGNAAHLAAIAAELNDSDVIPRFEHFIDRLGRPAGTLEAVYQIFNEAYRRAPRKARAKLEPYFKSLMPKLENRQARERRRLASDCRAEVRVQTGSGARQLYGQVVDLCEAGHGCQIRFDKSLIAECSNVMECGTVPTAPFINREVALRDRSGQEHHFSKGLITLFPPTLGAHASVECEGWVLRGFNYELKFGVKTDEAGVVFWYQDEPASLRDYRLTLPMILGDEQQNPSPVPSGLYAIVSSEPVPVAIAKVDCPVKGIPFKEGMKGLIGGFKEYLLALAEDIAKGDSRAFWSRGKPVDERSIDAQLRKSLQLYVESRGGHLSSQATTGLGICDYLIYRDTDRLLIELKPSYGKWRQGIDAELATYIKALEGQKAAEGVFLVFAFNKSFMVGSGELRDLLARRDACCTKHNVRIHIAVMYCDAGKAGSKTTSDTVHQLGDALRFFEYDGNETH